MARRKKIGKKRGHKTHIVPSHLMGKTLHKGGHEKAHKKMSRKHSGK